MAASGNSLAYKGPDGGAGKGQSFRDALLVEWNPPRRQETTGTTDDVSEAMEAACLKEARKTYR